MNNFGLYSFVFSVAACLGGCVQLIRTSGEFRALPPNFAVKVALPYQTIAACWSNHGHPTFIDFKKSSAITIYADLGVAEVTTGGTSLMEIKKFDDKNSTVTSFVENANREDHAKWLDIIKKCEAGTLSPLGAAPGDVERMNNRPNPVRTE
jgi:hypothetical protein